MMPPPALDATLTLDGFTATVPGEQYGLFSGWAAVFAFTWFWGAAFVSVGVSETAWFAGAPLFVVYALAVVGMTGWIVAWLFVDTFLAGLRDQGVVADGQGVTVGDQMIKWQDVEALGELERALVLELRDGGLQLVPIGGVAPDDRLWLLEQLEVLHVRYAHDGAPPEALRQMTVTESR